MGEFCDTIVNMHGLKIKIVYVAYDWSLQLFDILKSNQDKIIIRTQIFIFSIIY